MNIEKAVKDILKTVPKKQAFYRLVLPGVMDAIYIKSDCTAVDFKRCIIEAFKQEFDRNYKIDKKPCSGLLDVLYIMDKDFKLMDIGSPILKKLKKHYHDFLIPSILDEIKKQGFTVNAEIFNYDDISKEAMAEFMMDIQKNI